jgi:levansucrase
VLISGGDHTVAKELCTSETIRHLISDSAGPTSVLRSREHLLWDNWVVFDSRRQIYHRYSLSAARKFGPENRHMHSKLRHFTSQDGIKWRDLGIALEGRKTSFDEIIWSGSAMVRPNGSISLLYTGARSTTEKTQLIAEAISEDGHHFRRVGTILDWTTHDVQKRAKALGYDFSQDDGVIMAWRDPFRIENLLLFASKVRSKSGTISPAIGRAQLVTSQSGDRWELKPPIALPLGPEIKQIEVPNMIKTNRGFYLFVSTCDQLPEEPAGTLASTQIRVFRANSPNGPWKPATRNNGILLDNPSRIYALNLVRGLEAENLFRAVAFYQEPHPHAFSLTPIFGIQMGKDGMLSVNPSAHIPAR